MTVSLVDLFPEDARVGFIAEAREYSAQHGADLKGWWSNAPRGNWLIWVAGHCGVGPQHLVLAAIDCARETIALAPPESHRSAFEAMELLERWSRGQVSTASCAEASDRIYDFANRCEGVPNVAAARMASGAIESAANAAWHSDDRNWYIQMATSAVSRAAISVKHAEGEPGFVAINKKFANLVRMRIPESALDASIFQEPITSS